MGEEVDLFWATKQKINERRKSAPALSLIRLFAYSQIPPINALAGIFCFGTPLFGAMILAHML